MSNSSNQLKLTKDQLKEKLTALGVQLPSGNQLKSVYADLYTLAKKNMAGGHFSSDEEVVEVKSLSRRSQRLVSHFSEGTELNGNPRSLLDDEVQAYANIKRFDMQPKKKKIVEEVDGSEKLEDLGNNEIRARLKSLGVVVNTPIAVTTRKLYLKKLKTLLEEESKKEDVNTYSDTSEQEEGEEEEEEEEVVVEEVKEVVEVVPVHQTRSSTRRRTINVGGVPLIQQTRSEGSKTRPKTYAKDLTFSSRSPAAAAKPRRPLHQNVEVTETDTVVKKVTIQTKEVNETTEVAEEKVVAKPERRWIPVWVQVIITGLVVLFIYLVFQAMESNPDKLFLPKD